jgi:hypothetical protein
MAEQYSFLVVKYPLRDTANVALTTTADQPVKHERSKHRPRGSERDSACGSGSLS